MRALVLSLFIFIGWSLPSEAVDVVRSGSHLFLQDRSCEVVSDVAQSLNQWTTIEGGHPDCSSDRVQPFEAQGTCQFDITTCVPEHVAKYQGVLPKDQGPNCWNLAMVMKGILPALRFTTPEEMAFYLRSPLCRAVCDVEAKQPGDVGAIRTENSHGTTEYHGFIYISDKIAYSKDGFSNGNPYALQPLDSMLKLYKFDDRTECAKAASKPASCLTKTSYFRCSSMEDYLSRHPDTPREVRAMLGKLGSFESCLQSEAIQGVKLSPQSQTALVDMARALDAYLVQETAKAQAAGPSTDEQRFLLGALQLRLRGIARQLTFDNQNHLRSELFDLQVAIYNDDVELAKRQTTPPSN